jgi:hydrogenase expression/formation protein HypC
MCIGIPMQVIAAGEGIVECEGRGRRERLNFMLLGEQPVGTWVLAFQGSALRTMTAEEAAHTDRALDALDAALIGGGDLDHFFADLTNRAPELPAHLKGDKP